MSGRFEEQVKEAQKAITDTNNFFGAYASKCDQVELKRLMAQSSVRMVMMIHGKRGAGTMRKTFTSIPDILTDLFEEVSKIMPEGHM